MDTSQSETTRQSIRGAGLIIMGNEILDGRREDAHFRTARTLLAERHLELLYCLTLPDDATVITGQLLWAFNRGTPFFCCGGIGATPDDKTRQCAAAALGLDLEFHAEGLKILTERFGPEVNSARRRLVEFPAGAVLIPNPVNRVPGFTLRNGHFVPGFPKMASGMMAWVLDHLYAPGIPRGCITLLVSDTPESELCNLMNAFESECPGVTLSSLPLETRGKLRIHLGLSGELTKIPGALHLLRQKLDAAGFPFEQLTGDKPPPHPE